MEGLLARTGCQFFIPEADDSKQCHGEVGLYGTKPAIQKAKLEIKALAVSLKFKPSLVDVRLLTLILEGGYLEGCVLVGKQPKTENQNN